MNFFFHSILHIDQGRFWACLALYKIMVLSSILGEEDTYSSLTTSCFIIIIFLFLGSERSGNVATRV